jgi:putative membrane protein
MIFLNNKDKIGIAILAMFHLIGWIGLSFTPYSSFFALLTPLNLLLTLGVILYFHQSFTKNFFIFLIVSFLIGFFVEVAGVHTGRIFGEYAYSNVLGPRLFEVPLMIGVNWFLLLYTIGAFLSSLSFSKTTNVILGAALMTATDFFIEPFAINYKLWEWTDTGKVPLQNYAAWFAISYFLFRLYFYLDFTKENKVAAFAFFIMLIFFILNNIV